MAMNSGDGAEGINKAVSNAVNFNIKKAYKICAAFIPETWDFPIQDASTFCSAFRQQLLQLQEHLEDASLNVIKLEDLEIGFEGDKTKNTTKNDATSE